MTRSKRALAVGFVAALGLVAACGDDDNTTATTSGAATTAATATTGGATTATTGGAATATTGGSATSAGATATTGATASTGGAATTAPAGTAAPAVKNPKVGLLYDITGRGDRSFNDAAAAGLDKAKAAVGAVGTESTPSSEGDRAERLNNLIASGQDLIIGVGFLWGPTLQAAAVKNPDQKFGLIDAVAVDDKGTPNDPSDDVVLTNVASMTFAEEQGSFLIGAAAALKSKTGKIGFVGGVETDLIKKFEAGYTAGAKAVKPDIQVAVQYITQPPDFTGFNDPAKGKEIATSMYSDGNDVVYAAAGGSGLGVIQAAADTGKAGSVWAIGVDSDQYNLVDAKLQPYVLTSMLKKVDVAVDGTIEALANGTWRGGQQVFDLKAGGVDYSTSGGFLDDIKTKLDDYKQQIIDGKITVPTKP
jgi:basic membrane protein A and related proteins